VLPLLDICILNIAKSKKLKIKFFIYKVFQAVNGPQLQLVEMSNSLEVERVVFKNCLSDQNLTLMTTLEIGATPADFKVNSPPPLTHSYKVV
jgi:hypothetical protein